MGEQRSPKLRKNLKKRII